ncbi:MAG: AAA family ATPase, partial [Myxococcales bacterium]|nr:AAA family ATPase [Myxococcales bacterium]
MTSQSTSDPVSVRLFGRLTVLVGDDVVSGSLSSIARELLAYLLLHRSRDHARSILVGQFWGDLSESDARYALRQALWQIRGAIGERLVADSFSVGLATDAAFEVDVEEFQRRTSHLVRATDAPSALPVSIDRAGEARDLRAALALYRGDLLEEMTHPTIEAERERLRERYLHALLRLCAFEKSAENFEGALELALRITAVEPLQEAAHREAMRIYYLLGRPREALRHFERCSAVLIDELGIGPDAETARLAAEIGARIEDSAISAAYLPEPERDPPLVIKRPLELPLVGRQRERREILEALRAGLGGHSALLLVEGAPGLGKSRLLQEAVRDATWRGYDALMRGAGAWRSESPYGAVLETLGQGLSPVRARQIVPRLDRQARSVIAALMPRLTSVVPELAEALFVPTITDVEPVVDAVGGLIEAWTRRAPLLLALDDLQWADGDSLSLVASLVSRLESAQLANGVVLVLAYRGADARSRPLFWSQLEALDESPLLARRLRLEPLGVEDTARLVRRGLGYRRPASPLEEQVHRTTQGSPLFVLEYLAASLEAGRLVKSDTGEWCIEEAAVSDPSLSIRRESVEQTIADRLDGVPPLAQHVVAAAATLGTDVDYGTLRDATQLEGDALLESLLELRQRRLLFESAAGLHFSHDVVREVAYDRLSADERTALHANVAQAIEQRHASQSELLARHFEKAGAWEKVIEYASEAGARAERVHAPHAAITHYFLAIATYAPVAQARSRDQEIRRFEL